MMCIILKHVITIHKKIKYKNLKSAVEVMDKAAQIIRQIDDAGIVVRGVTRMRRLHGILWV